MDRKLDELLHALTENMTLAVSGEKLARDLGVSHSTLVRWIEKLRNAGVEIRGELFTGYRLLRLPDIMLPQFIRPRLHAGQFGRTIYHFYTVDSTNAFAARLIAHARKVPDGTLVIAETQTAGKGRMGRSWHSERESGLYFSIVLRPRIPSRLAPLLTLGCAVALHHAIEKETGLDVDIKWPNDLLVDGKKVAGILAEVHGEIDQVSTLIVGVGVNVNHASLPEDLAGKAISLRLAAGRPQSRIEILLAFLDQLEALIGRFEAQGPSAIIDEWSRHSSFATGRRLTVRDAGHEVEGVTRGLNAFGGLVLETPDGRLLEIYSGDVADV